MKWIKCKTSLPKTHKEALDDAYPEFLSEVSDVVIVLTNNKEITSGRLVDGKWDLYNLPDYSTAFKAIAWIPMPDL